jgi:hypothetical protein
MEMNKKNNTISRRGLLTTGAVAAGSAALVSQSAAILGQGPAVVTTRRFRGWVTRGAGPNRTTLQELTLRPVTGRQIAVRTEATNLCYSNVGSVLGLQAAAAPPPGGGRGAPPAGGAGAGRGFAAAGQGAPPAPAQVRPRRAVARRPQVPALAVEAARSSRGMAELALLKPWDPKFVVSRWATVSVCRAHPSAVPVISACGAGPTCASS